MKLAIAGKGGAGKTTISGTLARQLARQGYEVLALDNDLNPNLSLTVGIPAEQLTHVFDKFFQADNQSAATQKGSGLGLAIAREIVEAHDGTIRVVSTRGAGTTFTIDLPAVTGERTPTIEPARGGDAGRQPVAAGRA